MIDRNIDKIIENHYANSKSALLLTGARQVGKTVAFRRYAEKTGMAKRLIVVTKGPLGLFFFV